jgi:hypothetical protein
MPTSLPNPFLESALERVIAADAAAAPDLADRPVAAAGFQMSAEFERKLFEAILPLPIFLSSPRPEFLEAAEFDPIRQLLSSYARRWPRASLLPARVWA